MLKVPLSLCLLLLLAPLHGCVEPNRDPALAKIAMPSDFALELTVHGDPAASDPLRQPSQYVLEPNRRLRAVTGLPAGARSFPRLVRVLSPADYEALYQIIDDAHLMVEPTSPGAEALRAGKAPESPALYELRIHAHGRTHRYATTPTESPPTVRLHARLAELATGAGAIRPPSSRPAATEPDAEADQ
jgi:hypothetical protein